MGCVSSTFLHHDDDDFPQIGSSALGHHIVSLTSTTYGLLSLDPPPPPRPFHSSPTTPPPPAPRFTVGSVLNTPISKPRSLRSEPEVINSWELMAGLENDSFRFSPLPLLPSPKMFSPKFTRNKENFNPNRNFIEKPSVFKSLLSGDRVQNQTLSSTASYPLGKFEKLCPPSGENKVVIYTTTLRGVRKTFEACNAVRSAMEGLGITFCERDISMDRGFREELKELMKNKDLSESVPPRVFVRGRYLGGSEEVLRIHEEGSLAQLLDGLPKAKVGEVCDGCGGARFLPCFQCNGSCKIVMAVKSDSNEKLGKKTVVVTCCLVRYWIATS
ncbi:hypothetical protein V2J09_022195 [Rumex salicifolius]